MFRQNFCHLQLNDNKFCRNMSCKLKKLIVFLKIFTCLLLFRPFKNNVVVKVRGRARYVYSLIKATLPKVISCLTILSV